MSVVIPKKWLGQHFLEDENIAKLIVGHLNIQNKNILEIGPGTGVLTKYLLEEDINLKVIEIDKESVVYISSKYELENKIINADFLKYDLFTIFGNNFSIIGNFPYNISSQILFKAIENKDIVDEIVGMFQKEVAERICSDKGSRVYGIISVLVQAFYETEYLFTVEPHVFNPPPKVRSAVIRLKRRTNTVLPCDEKNFFIVVKKAFNQRRKTLRNALKGLEFNSNVPAEFFQKRAEQLSVDDFILLTQSLVS